MASLRLMTSFDLCTGCKTCEMVCSLRSTGGFNANKALLRIEEDRQGFGADPVVCAQCQNPLCERACLFSAFERDERTGAIVIDSATCRGCGMCDRACPLHVIQKKGRKYVKCDLCGGDPLCVRFCPTGAITLIDMDTGRVGTARQGDKKEGTGA
jgi:Fe-S-cluster-containing hydrogenase component 2